jgi:SecD/SecF fusion protein
MRRYLPRILICLLPVIASILVVWWAYTQYDQGRGGFRLGVDLAGGTILVYEVDETRMPPDFKSDELAAALKKRIDPNDLYNITIRPVGSSPPRVEIILPTGGQHQAQAEERNWAKLLEAVRKEYPVKGVEKPYDGPAIGRNPANLSDAIFDAQKAENPKLTPEDRTVLKEKINAFVEKQLGGSRGRETLTSSEVENIKNLIEKQGRLEFRILANTVDDGPAIDAARKWISDPANRSELDRLNQKAEPPPGPKNPDGSPFFPTALQGHPAYTYSWVEVGKSELHSLKLNTATLEQAGNQDEANIRAALAGSGIFAPSGGMNNLYYVREITDWSRRRSKDQKQHKHREFFVLTRDAASKDAEITGDFLAGAHEQQSTSGKGGGGFSIAFSFTNEGGNRFYELTNLNKPASDNSFKRNLAILFDSQIVSAPYLNAVISTNGEITGNFTQQDVQDMVRIMRAGALPATLKKDPVSQNSMGATLGQDTITKGTWAVGCAFLAVMIFMCFYYRVAGGVACTALLANLLLTVAFMVVVKAAFTLPGLAGLVLMLGMAVDANVLIYERLREEREGGATLALAIRNGYDRAFPTIIDTHLSSIFTAIVLYAVGNDQLKGFGISLTVGLIISLFTSLYMTRTMFEVMLGEGWIKDLRFAHVRFNLGGWKFDLHHPGIDFMAIRYYWFTATIILTILGAGLFFYRVSDPKNPALNIDFVGGTAYTAELSTPLSIDELHKKLTAPQDNEEKLPGLSIDQVFLSEHTDLPPGKSYLFTVRTSNKATQQVMDFVNEQLKGELKLIRLDKYEWSPQSLATLTFQSKDGKSEGFAAPDAVEKVVKAELEAKGVLALEPKTTFEIIKGGEEGKDKDKGKFSKLQVRLTPAVPFEKFESVFKAVQEKLTKDGTTTTFETPLQSDVTLTFKEQLPDGTVKTGDEVKASIPQITNVLRQVFAKLDKSTSEFEIQPASEAHDEHAAKLSVRLNQALPVSEIESILKDLGTRLDRTAQPLRLENFDAQLASSTRDRATWAILLSWVAILAYLWFRFGSWTFGAATVLCLIHDLFFTLGAIVACHYVYRTWFGWALQIQDFKFDLQSVAALLTLVGYSVNDTIVVFDRIREVRGKNPALTPEMINASVNQTLSRTLLASMTVWLVVVVLYFFGGEGVHLFAFVMVVGVIVGTYSSIYIASPLLLIFGEGHAHLTPAERARLTQPSGAKG